MASPEQRYTPYIAPNGEVSTLFRVSEQGIVYFSFSALEQSEEYQKAFPIFPFSDPFLRSIEPYENNECPISSMPIKNFYCQCNSCHTNFDKGALESWLSINPICPLCHQNWTSFDVYWLYIPCFNRRSI